MNKDKYFVFLGVILIILSGLLLIIEPIFLSKSFSDLEQIARFGGGGAALIAGLIAMAGVDLITGNLNHDSTYKKSAERRGNYLQQPR